MGHTHQPHCEQDEPGNNTVTGPLCARGDQVHDMWHFAHGRCPVVLGCPLEPPLGLLTAVIFADKVLQ